MNIETTVGRWFQSSKVDVLFLALNLIGCIAYDYGASSGWRIPEEHGMIPITGEPFVWFAGILPVLVCLLLINLGWLVIVLRRRRRPHSLVWLPFVTMWFAAVAFDFAHH